jgi:maleylpyruvate isomerase
MSTTEEAARDALRQRLGGGARYDAIGAPARELAWARRGTAYFSRKLNELSDDALDARSLIPGWSRRHVIAHVGYNARALARLVEGVRTGIPLRMFDTDHQRLEEIRSGATLPARALRNLFRHSEIHLNVEWRDLGAAHWNATAAEGISIRRTPAMRASVVWLGAVDLGNGGSFLDMPPDLLDALLEGARPRLDALGAAMGGLRLEITDRAPEARGERTRLAAVTGRAADVARWASGRGSRNLHFSGPPSLESLPLAATGAICRPLL